MDIRSLTIPTTENCEDRSVMAESEISNTISVLKSFRKEKDPKYVKIAMLRKVDKS